MSRATHPSPGVAATPRRGWKSSFRLLAWERDTKHVSERNVLGGELETCCTDPLTGFYRDGCCSTGPEDLGRHTICAVVTAEFLEHQRSIGNDLLTPVPEYQFPGLLPGDRWCVTALNWLRAHHTPSTFPTIWLICKQNWIRHDDAGRHVAGTRGYERGSIHRSLSAASTAEDGADLKASQRAVGLRLP